jgi:CDP-diacylglycerol--serine O-phosphatidyltransferase
VPGLAGTAHDDGASQALKKIAIIPTLLTLGNAVCGFAAIAYASKINVATDADTYFAMSGWLIIAAMLFDALDGYVARLSRSASNFGLQLDSLCDAISFGVAPAFLLMRMGPGWETPRLHQTLAVIAALYMVCALLRLARFNVETHPDPSGLKRFRGLPSPGAAGCLASLAILRAELALKWNLDPANVQRWVEVCAPVGALIVAVLMVSRVPYPHLTKQILRGRKPFRHLVQVVLAAFVLVLLRDLALVLIFWLYAIVIPFRYVMLRGVYRGTVSFPSPGLDDGGIHQGT